MISPAFCLTSCFLHLLAMLILPHWPFSKTSFLKCTNPSWSIPTQAIPALGEGKGLFLIFTRWRCFCFPKWCLTVLWQNGIAQVLICSRSFMKIVAKTVHPHSAPVQFFKHGNLSLSLLNCYSFVPITYHFYFYFFFWHFLSSAKISMLAMPCTLVLSVDFNK